MGLPLLMQGYSRDLLRITARICILVHKKLDVSNLFFKCRQVVLLYRYWNTYSVNISKHFNSQKFLNILSKISAV
jgi:hypothetical protein